MIRLALYYTFLFLFFTAPAFAVQPKDLPHIDIDVPSDTTDNMNIRSRDIELNANTNSIIDSISFIGDERIDDLVQAPIKIGSSIEQQSLIDYAREKTHSIDFILTVERESGRRWDAVGDNGGAYGLCQWNPHNMGANWRQQSTDPVLENGYTMIDGCWKTRQLKGKNVGSWLHAYKVRHTVKDRFIFSE